MYSYIVRPRANERTSKREMLKAAVRCAGTARLQTNRHIDVANGSIRTRRGEEKRGEANKL